MDMLDEMRRAAKFIFMEFFILSPGYLMDTLYDVLERHIRYISTLQDKVKLYENDIEKQLVQFTEQKRKEADVSHAGFMILVLRLVKMGTHSFYKVTTQL